MKNIILIGMMGCGKTTVGGLLAQRLGRTLADTDQLIEDREGRSIPAIFAENGEEYFRDLELIVSKELSEREDLIVSCGGGLPLRAEAIAALKKNGIAFWLDRDPGETYDGLDTAGRPLAQGGREDFVKRYQDRAPVYRAAADYLVLNPESADYAARLVASIYWEECEP